MANTVRYIQALGIHGRFDLELELQPGVNILYGKNGTGKTTLLHILANILNGDFERFAFLPFETIEVELDDKQKIKLREYSHREGNKVEVSINNKPFTEFLVEEIKEKFTRRSSSTRSINPTKIRPVLSTAYFPAFRTLIEASGYNDEATSYYDAAGAYLGEIRLGGSSRELNPTDFARRFFGNFVPSLNYPSPEEVSRRISQEMQKALNDIADTDRQLLSKAFLDIFATLSKESNPDENQLEPILEKIQTLLENTSIPIMNDSSVGEEVYSNLRPLVLAFKARPGKEDIYVPILEVYKSSLEERANIQEKALKIINTYITSVNRFLDDKQIVLLKSSSQKLPTLQVQFNNTSVSSQIQALSSGERQIVTLLYSATHMSGQRVVLIDEPEISLHIDWQSLLIPEMVAQLQDRQIITCTHSPMIGADYEDQMIELELKPTHSSINGNSSVQEGFIEEEGE